MPHKGLAKHVCLALLAALAQSQTVLAVTTATGEKEVRPVFDHNFNRAVYSGKPIVAPHVHVEAPRIKKNIDDEQASSDDRHLTFIGHADEPVAMEKLGDVRYDVQGAKSPDVVRVDNAGEKSKTRTQKRGADDSAKDTSTGKLPESVQQLNSVLKSNWSTWTAKSDGKLSLPAIAALLGESNLPADQINALSALANHAEALVAQAYNNHQLQPGNMILEQGKNGTIQLLDGAKGTPKTINIDAVATSFAGKPDEEQGCNSALKIELLQYWNTWTASTGGVMTFAQFNKLCAQTHPPITGAQAAALGAIGNQLNDIQYADFKSSSSAPLVTLKLQVSADGQVTMVNGSGQQVQTGNYAFNYYAPGARMLAQDVAGQGKIPGNRQDHLSLYGSSNTVVINDVRQGDYNDCFFLASVWATMQNYGTPYVQNMIKQVGPNKFDVTFPGYAHNPISVDITPTEASMFSRTTNGGCYLSVLALAADRIVTNRAGTDSKTRDQLTPLYAIVNCGYDRPFLQLLTGQKYTRIESPKGPTQATTHELAAYNEKLQNFESAIEKGINDHQPVNVATSDHFMTITAYSNASSPTALTNYQGPSGAPGPYVTIHNQWGNTGPYQLAGTDITVHMENGYFTVPVADMAKYGLIAIQVPGVSSKVDAPLLAGAPKIAIPNPLDESPRLVDDVKIGNSPRIDEPRRFENASRNKERATKQTSQTKATGSTPTRSHMKGMDDTKSDNGGANTGPISTSSDTGSGGTIRQFDMVNGTVFVAHVDPVRVNIPGGMVKIAGGAAVYISRHDDACAVFNLTNTSHGGVVVSSGGKERTVAVGQAVITCANPDKEFDSINPCKAVLDSSHVKLVDSSSALRTFAASYSPIAVLDNSAQFAELIKSKDPADRALAERILKTAAALSQMTPQ